MITVHRVESKNEETRDKVRVRLVVSTEPVKGATELRNQIAKLMDAPTRAGQATALAVLQIAPDREAVGEDRWTGTLLDAPTPIMAKLVWDRLLPLKVPLLAMAW